MFLRVVTCCSFDLCRDLFMVVVIQTIPTDIDFYVVNNITAQLL